ncbi:MAG: rhomboid family intramembrane serine protease [Nitrospirae bacterium]|nr:rhomboid family intramembrane serine protease [Nitrospirota bacterium]
MIPLSDTDRRPLNFPIVTAVTIAVNAVVFFFELTMDDTFVIEWAYVPSEIAAGKRLLTLLTAMFMHGGWFHIIGNMVYLWAFGPEIEDVMGRGRYLAFYLLGGLAASLAQIGMNPSSNIPNLGASGAIAAVMGAFLITFPRDRIRTLVFLGWFVTITMIPAVILVGFWFLIQLFSGIGALTQRQSGGGIAYMAHVGGLVFGALTAKLFESRKRLNARGLRR